MVYTKYPGAIDSTTELPVATDLVTPVNAEVVNRHRDAVVAIEGELGVEPSGTYTTVRARLDAMELGGGGGGGGCVDGYAPTQRTLSVLVYNQTVFDLGIAPSLPSATEFFVNGIKYRYGVDFTISGMTITWAGTPVLLVTDVVDVIFYRSGNAAPIQQTFIATPAQTLFYLGATSVLPYATEFFVNGIKNRFATDYNISGSTVTYLGTPILVAGDVVDIIYYIASGSSGGSGAGTQTLAQTLALGNNANALSIVNMADPINPQDASTKAYVDAQITAHDSLSEVLDHGNTTDGYDIIVSTGDSILGAAEITIAAAASLVGAGSNASLSAGDGSTDGGDVNIVAGSGTDGGGDALVWGGAGVNNDGGAAGIIAGSSATGDGGYGVVYGGGSTSGVGGYAYLTAGTSVSGPGGWAYVSGGNSTDGNAGYAALIGGTSTNADGGWCGIIAGDGYTTGGSIDIWAADGAVGNGGHVDIVGGDSSEANGGYVSIDAGDGYIDGGNIDFRAGNGSNGIGGSIALVVGTGPIGDGNITLDGYTLINNDLAVTGKLYVDGLIDPTGMVLSTQVSVPGGIPGVDKTTLWARSSDGYLVQSYGAREVAIMPRTLAQTLVVGNITGTTDIEMSTGTRIVGTAEITIDAADSVAGDGSSVTISAGDSDSGDGGDAFLYGGNTVSGDAGETRVSAGGNTNGTGGRTWVLGGTGTQGGDLYINAGQGTLFGGGTTYIAGGVGSAGGEIQLQGGYGSGSDGGNAYLWGGGGDNNGGDAHISGGTGGSLNGGDTFISTGVGVVLDGYIIFERGLTEVARWDNVAGGRLLMTSSVLDMNNNVIQNVLDPIDAQDAATKNYVDGYFSANNEWKEILANGNVSGGTNPIISTGDELQGQTDLILAANSGDIFLKNTNIEWQTAVAAPTLWQADNTVGGGAGAITGPAMTVHSQDVLQNNAGFLNTGAVLTLRAGNALNAGGGGTSIGGSLYLSGGSGTTSAGTIHFQCASLDKMYVTATTVDFIVGTVDWWATTSSPMLYHRDRTTVGVGSAMSIHSQDSLVAAAGANTGASLTGRAGNAAAGTGAANIGGALSWSGGSGTGTAGQLGTGGNATFATGAALGVGTTSQGGTLLCNGADVTGAFTVAGNGGPATFRAGSVTNRSALPSTGGDATLNAGDAIGNIGGSGATTYTGGNLVARGGDSTGYGQVPNVGGTGIFRAGNAYTNGVVGWPRNDATGGILTVNAGDAIATAVANAVVLTGAAGTIRGGDATSFGAGTSQTCIGGTLTVRGGNATLGAVSNTGGDLILSGGAGATTAGVIYFGSTNVEWQTAVATPTLWQANKTTAGVAAAMVIHAQNVSGAVAATGGALTVNAGDNICTAGAETGGLATFRGGDVSGASGGANVGGGCTIRAGNATNGATNTGGDLILINGTGATANGSILLQNGSGSTVLTVNNSGVTLSYTGLAYAASVTSPRFYQIDDSTAGVTGDLFRINAQSATGTGAATGGAISVTGGNVTGAGTTITSGAATFQAGDVSGAFTVAGVGGNATFHSGAVGTVGSPSPATKPATSGAAALQSGAVYTLGTAGAVAISGNVTIASGSVTASAAGSTCTSGDVILDTGVASGGTTNTDGYIIFKRGGVEIARWDDGGSDRLYLSGTEVVEFGSGVTNPEIRQEIAVGSAGNNLTITAQAAASGAYAGGNLILGAGADGGTGIDGYVYVKRGPTEVTRWDMADGEERLLLNSQSLYFDSTVVAPIIGQVQEPVGAGDTLTIRAQNSNGGYAGGDLDLCSGYSTTSDPNCGAVTIYQGNVERLTFAAGVGGGSVTLTLNGAIGVGGSTFTITGDIGGDILQCVDDPTAEVKMGFFGTPAVFKQDVGGVRNNPESALANLLTALANLGLITDSTSAS